METQEALAVTAARAVTDTIPKMFWRGATEWRGAGQPAAEAFRHLAEHHLGRVRPDRARDRHGAGGARLRAGRMRLGALQHQPRMALRRHGHFRRRRGFERHLSDRRAGAGRIPLRGLRARSTCSSRTTSSSTRRWRCARRLPKLRKIFVFDMDGLRDFSDPQVMSLDALRAIGRDYDAAHPAEWERRVVLRKPTDLAVLIYTSGTTGKPKGAMLSHANLVAAMHLYAGAFAQHADDERMCFLPLCHVAERIVGVYTAFLTGTRLNFVENPETVPENVREIAPDRVRRWPCAASGKVRSARLSAMPPKTTRDPWMHSMARRRRRGPVTATVGWGHRSPQKTQKATDTTTTTTSLVLDAPSDSRWTSPTRIRNDAPHVRPERWICIAGRSRSTRWRWSPVRYRPGGCGSPTGSGSAAGRCRRHRFVGRRPGVSVPDHQEEPVVRGCRAGAVPVGP